MKGVNVMNNNGLIQEEEEKKSLMIRLIEMNYTKMNDGRQLYEASLVELRNHFESEVHFRG
jgi:uncharacterized protein (DUF934 family)